MKTRQVVELLENVRTLEQLVSDLQEKVRELEEAIKSTTPRATPVKKTTK